MLLLKKSNSLGKKRLLVVLHLWDTFIASQRIFLDITLKIILFEGAVIYPQIAARNKILYDIFLPENKFSEEKQRFITSCI